MIFTGIFLILKGETVFAKYFDDQNSQVLKTNLWLPKRRGKLGARG